MTSAKDPAPSTLLPPLAVVVGIAAHTSDLPLPLSNNERTTMASPASPPTRHHRIRRSVIVTPAWVAVSTLLAVLLTGVIMSPPAAFAADPGPGFSGSAGYVGASRVGGAPAYCIDADLPSPVGAPSTPLAPGQPEPARLSALNDIDRSRLHWLTASYGATDDPVRAAAVTMLVWSIVGASDDRGDDRPWASIPPEHHDEVRALLSEMRDSMTHVRVAEPLVAPRATLTVGSESASSAPESTGPASTGAALVGSTAPTTQAVSGSPASDAPARASSASTETSSTQASSLETTPPTSGSASSAPSPSPSEPGLSASGPDFEAMLDLSPAPSGTLVGVELDGATFPESLGGQRMATLAPTQQVLLRIDPAATHVSVRLTALHEPTAWTPELQVFVTPQRQSLIQAPQTSAPASALRLAVTVPTTPVPPTTPAPSEPPAPTASPEPPETPEPEQPAPTASPEPAATPEPSTSSSPEPPAPSPPPSATPVPTPHPGAGPVTAPTPPSPPRTSTPPPSRTSTPPPSPAAPHPAPTTDSLAHTGGDAAGMLIGAGVAILAVGLGGWLLSRRYRDDHAEQHS